MTSTRQIEANRRDAVRSTGPTSEDGKARASQNAVRHGLTAETLLVPLENPDDYQAFEQSVTADYEAETAVERELVLRLASLLWRLRRATSVETGLLQIEDGRREEAAAEENSGPTEQSADAILFPSPSRSCDQNGYAASDPTTTRNVGLAVAQRFVRLADLDNGVFERLARYEAALWRQVRQTLFTLEALRWRAPSARRWRHERSWQRTMSSPPELD